ncbi:MAG: XdhC/CoxI family protein [Anaerolineales bacterium]|nr:XdhC/CoxI family protein [Anaerolineales bacterium]
MDQELINALAELTDQGKSGALCTVVKTKGSTPRKEGSKMLVYPDRSIVGTVGGGEVEGRVIARALEAMKSGKPEILSFDLIDPGEGDPGVCGGVLDVFIEPLQVPFQLIIVGGGHVGREVVRLAHWLGYRVILNDDREEFCTPESAPEADRYLVCEIDQLPDQVDLDSRTAVVLATRNMGIDTQGLPGILEHHPAYVGVIGSRRRWKLTREALLEDGVSEERVDQVHAPIGLDLNAETPEEIALSIMAEVVMVQGGGKGVSLSTL